MNIVSRQLGRKNCLCKVTRFSRKKTERREAIRRAVMYSTKATGFML